MGVNFEGTRAAARLAFGREWQASDQRQWRGLVAELRATLKKPPVLTAAVPLLLVA